MNTENLDEATKAVDDIYDQLAPMATSIMSSFSKNLDAMIDQINAMPTLTNEEIRLYMLKLSIESYIFAGNKDTASLKSACAKALLQEKQAILFNEAEGTVNARTNIATINSSDNQIVNILYNTVTDLMKTKLDETHRMINALSNILISRQADAKIEASQQGPQQQKTLLNEEMMTRTEEDYTPPFF